MNSIMMGIKKTSLLLLVAAVVIGFGRPAHAQWCQVIKISKGGEDIKTGIYPIPESVTVPLETFTVWVNLVDDMKVKVSFPESAKTCMEAAQLENGFGVFDLGEGESYYISEELNLGESAGLVWKETGEYTYTLEAAAMGSKPDVKPVFVTGVIIVR